MQRGNWKKAKIAAKEARRERLWGREPGLWVERGLRKKKARRVWGALTCAEFGMPK